MPNELPHRTEGKPLEPGLLVRRMTSEKNIVNDQVLIAAFYDSANELSVWETTYCTYQQALALGGAQGRRPIALWLSVSKIQDISVDYQTSTGDTLALRLSAFWSAPYDEFGKPVTADGWKGHADIRPTRVPAGTPGRRKLDQFIRDELVRIVDHVEFPNPNFPSGKP